MIDQADFAGWFLTLVAIVVACCTIGYAWIAVKEDIDADDEIVERQRLNLIVRWPR